MNQMNNRQEALSNINSFMKNPTVIQNKVFRAIIACTLLMKRQSLNTGTNMEPVYVAGNSISYDVNSDTYYFNDSVWDRKMSTLASFVQVLNLTETDVNVLLSYKEYLDKAV